MPPTGAAPQDQYRNYPPGNYSGPRPGYPTPAGGNPAAPAPGAYPPNQAPQQDYYRQDQVNFMLLSLKCLSRHQFSIVAKHAWCLSALFSFFKLLSIVIIFFFEYFYYLVFVSMCSECIVGVVVDVPGWFLPLQYE